jgi:hypothetical protein
MDAKTKRGRDMLSGERERERERDVYILLRLNENLNNELTLNSS